MERRHIKWLPLLLAGLFFAYQYFSSEKFVNPEIGRKSHVAMSTREEALLGLQSYQQVLRSRRVSIRDGAGDGQKSGIAAGYRHGQSRYGLRLAGRIDSLLADKRLLFAGRQGRSLH